MLRREEQYVGKRRTGMEVPGKIKERKTELDMVVYHPERLVGETTSWEELHGRFKLRHP